MQRAGHEADAGADAGEGEHAVDGGEVPGAQEYG